MSFSTDVLGADARLVLVGMPKPGAGVRVVQKHEVVCTRSSPREHGGRTPAAGRPGRSAPCHRDCHRCGRN